MCMHLPNPFEFKPNPEKDTHPLPLFLSNPSREYLSAVQILPIPATVREILTKYCGA